MKFQGPLEVVGTPWEQQGPTGSGMDPLEAARTPWEQQGPLEAAGFSWK